jgi:hypothetical protein
MTKKLIVAALLMYSAPSHAYEVAAVSNGGKIEGKVTYNGAVPTKKIIPTKNKEVCGGPRDEPQILVGPDKGVEDAIVYLKDVAKGKEWGKADKNPLLDQENCKFRPTVQIIRPGPLDITSSDPVLHNTLGFYGRRTAFNLGLSNKGDKVTRELDKPGMVRVECDAHGWMLAWIYVADSPYYALTKKDGSFSIADVPPGDYAVVATQAHAGDTEAKVSVKPGEAAKVAIELKTK